MTSAVHDGIHNVPRHVDGVGRVDIMSSIYGLVVLQNQVLIYSPNLRLCPGNFRLVDGQCCFVPSLTQLPGASHLARDPAMAMQGDVWA